MSKGKDLTKGNIAQQLLLFFFPIFLGYFFQQLYNTFDAIIVGNYVGKEALAAVGGTTSTLLNLVINFIIGLTSGVTVIVAQSYGYGDYDSVKSSVKTGMFIGVVLGFIMTVLGILLSKDLLILMGVPNEIMQYSLTYMKIYFLGLIPSMIYNVGTSVLRAVGDSKRPLYFLIVACVTNILLDVIFVNVLHLAVLGVGIATVISQIISAILALLVLGKTDDCYHFELKDFGFDYEVLKKTITIGLPSGINSVLYSVSNLFIQATVNSFGTNTIAAYTAIGKVDALYWNFDSAFGIATMTLVGQNYGAKKYDRVKESMKYSFILEGIGTAIIIFACYFFGSQILRLFTSDADVIFIGNDILKFLSLSWWLFIPIEVISSSAKACGDVVYPMILTATGICGIRILYLIIFSFDNVISALYCYPLSWLITSIVYIIYLFKGKVFKFE